MAKTKRKALIQIPGGRRGKPTKLTQEVRETILDVVRAGNYMHVAAQYAGIAVGCLDRWLYEGRNALRIIEEPWNPKNAELTIRQRALAEFVREMDKARAEAEAREVAQIGAAAKTQWQAAAWLLERRNWKRWGRKDKLHADVKADMGLADLILLSMKHQREAEAKIIDGEKGANEPGALPEGRADHDETDEQPGGERESEADLEQ